MNKTKVNIDSIPQKIKKRITKHLYKKILLVGYKQFSTKCKTPLIEFPNKARIWVLIYEIKNSRMI
uniref:Cytochrome b6-f complex subunit PetP n=1 Tax=Chondria sp. (in: red algae) TaxID=1982705 RepID=A0A1Z1MQJ5_9FLOR|nr:cytochrome b6-f complex subunit PetP [Chondria sp. (in: red algae)]